MVPDINDINTWTNLQQISNSNHVNSTLYMVALSIRISLYHIIGLIQDLILLLLAHLLHTIIMTGVIIIAIMADIIIAITACIGSTVSPPPAI